MVSDEIIEKVRSELYRNFMCATTKEEFKEVIQDHIYVLDKMTWNIHKRVPAGSRIRRGGGSGQ